MSEGLSKRTIRRKKRQFGIEIAIQTFEARGIKYKLCCEENGHFHVWDKNGKLYQYLASTDRIMSHKESGLAMLILLLNRAKTTKK